MSASLADLVVEDKKVTSKFECPKCNKILAEPIIACSHGHNVCKLCINSYINSDWECPIESCESSPTKIPNVDMENAILELGLPSSSLPMSASIADLVVGDKSVKSKFECPKCSK
jgi:predicted RNA-binding Zn-ribbon protein involved in translation (DUF1610 family)